MKKSKRLITMLSLYGLVTFIASYVYPHLSRETGSYSGAPGESSCSSCHGSATNNSSVVSLTTTGSSTLPTSYQAGVAYLLTLSLNTTYPRYGFQITAANGTAKKGTWSIVDTNTSLATNRVTHNNAGTTKVWNLKWTAPATTGNGTVTFYISAIGANGDGRDNASDPTFNRSFAMTEASTADTTPPTVSIGAPAANATISGTVSITGTAADNVALSKVEIQIDGGTLQAATGTSSWNYSLNTTSLTNGSHTITAKVTDTSNNTATASRTVIVNNIDSTLPNITINTPSNGASVSGTISAAGSASDNVGLSKIEIQIDGGTLVTATGTSSWSYSLNTAALSNGSHTLTAKATDSSNNTKTASVTFTVNNVSGAPQISVNSPATGASVVGTINISGTAADNGTVSSVQIKVDNGAFQSATGTTNWSFALNTTGLSDGVHTVTAQATDDQNITTTFSITINVVNLVPPTMAITTLAPGATVKGVISVAGTAADNISVSLVQVKVDNGTFQSASGTSNWSFTLNTTGLSEGAHVITVQATDNQNNITTKSVSVTVANLSPPTVTFTNLSTGDNLMGIFEMTGVAGDDGSVSLVQVKVDNGVYQNATGTNDWSYSLNTVALLDGPHTITVRVTDNQNNATTISVSVTVSNLAPAPLAEGDIHLYHNRFNPNKGEQMTFQADIKSTTRLEVRIYDISGRLVKKLKEGTEEAGTFTLPWDGKDDNGKIVGDGIYLCEIKSDDHRSTRKIAVVKN